MKTLLTIQSDRFFENFYKVNGLGIIKENIIIIYGNKYKGLTYIDNLPSLIDKFINYIVLDANECDDSICSRNGIKYEFFTMVRFYQAFLLKFGKYPISIDELKSWK